MNNQLANYRNLVTLPDGSRVLLRPLVAGDRAALVELFARTAEEDRRYLVDDVTNRELVGGWADNLDYAKVFPLVAVLNDNPGGKMLKAGELKGRVEEILSGYVR